MSNFETWWEYEGQEFLFALNTTTDDDIKLVAEIAWKNGTCCAEQAEQEPVGVVEGSGEWGIAGVLVAGVPIGTKLYTHPVRTKDLTVSELDAIIEKHYDDEMDLKAMILDGIAAYREKNK